MYCKYWKWNKILQLQEHLIFQHMRNISDASAS